MTTAVPVTSLQLRSLVKASAELELSLASIATPEPRDDEVLVQIQASPMNPSDLGLLFGLADLSSAKASGSAARPVITASIPDKLMKAMASRLDQSMPVGNEGAGIVVRAGASPAAQALLGRTVAVLGGSMYSQYRCIKAVQCLVLPQGTLAAEGASCFVNPLTALCMLETMRLEGHKALVHTAAALNLGQMLNRICLKDGIGLVSIVRKPAQAELLRAQGALHVVDSSSAHFVDELTQALVATGATLAFDAIGGGRLAGQILSCMEAAINLSAKEYPLRFEHAQAGLPIRRPGPRPDRDQQKLRHGLERGRLVADAVPAKDRPRSRPEAAPTGCRRAQDHFRQPLHPRGVAGPGADAASHWHLQQALDR